MARNAIYARKWHAQVQIAFPQSLLPYATRFVRSKMGTHRFGATYGVGTHSDTLQRLSLSTSTAVLLFGRDAVVRQLPDLHTLEIFNVGCEWRRFGGATEKMSVKYDVRERDDNGMVVGTMHPDLFEALN